jgi:hypothetical protein
MSRRAKDEETVKLKLDQVVSGRQLGEGIAASREALAYRHRQIPRTDGVAARQENELLAGTAPRASISCLGRSRQ